MTKQRSTTGAAKVNFSQEELALLSDDELERLERLIDQLNPDAPAPTTSIERVGPERYAEMIGVDPTPRPLTAPRASTERRTARQSQADGVTPSGKKQRTGEAVERRLRKARRRRQLKSDADNAVAVSVPTPPKPKPKPKPELRNPFLRSTAFGYFGGQ